MDLSDAILKRRSIRKYKRDALTDDIVRKIVEAGMAAPSAGNLQSRYFYAVRNADLKKRLASISLSQAFIAEAPVVFVICADLRIEREYGARGTDLYAVIDCAAAVENMLLTATSLGLGTCWVGAFDEAKVSKLLDMPRHLRPISIIPCGYPDEVPEIPGRMSFEKACEFK